MIEALPKPSAWPDKLSGGLLLLDDVLRGGFGERVFAAYHEAFPLQAGWKERLDLYSLYHVLNHFNLFGGGYGAQATQTMRRYAG